MMENGWIIGMQHPPPTVPSWISWYRHLRPEHARALDRAGPRARAPSSFALYFNARNEPIRLDRINGLFPQKLGTMTPRLANLPWPTLPSAWRNHDPVPFDVFDLAVPFDHSTWRKPIKAQDISDIAVNKEAPGGRPAGWSSAARGWAAGAVLLLLLVLVVRAVEKCSMHFSARLFKTGRRDSEEWQTATVMATSVQNDNAEVGSLPRFDDSDGFSEPSINLSIDLPPPYSECASNMLASKLEYNEEPPPPYSACYVSFSNPKDDIPSVHIHRRQTVDDEQPHTSTEVDNVHNNLIESGYTAEPTPSSSYEEIDEDIRTELVFENGRIVERVSMNPNVNMLEISIDNILENRNINVNSASENGQGEYAQAGNSTDREIMV